MPTIFHVYINKHCVIQSHYVIKLQNLCALIFVPLKFQTHKLQKIDTLKKQKNIFHTNVIICIV